MSGVWDQLGNLLTDPKQAVKHPPPPPPQPKVKNKRKAPDPKAVAAAEKADPPKRARNFVFTANLPDDITEAEAVQFAETALSAIVKESRFKSCIFQLERGREGQRLHFQVGAWLPGWPLPTPVDLAYHPLLG